MAGFIRGIDPRDNQYTYSHPAGKHFRVKAGRSAGPAVSARVSIDKHGATIHTSFIPMRGRKTAREMGLAPILMTDKD